VAAVPKAVGLIARFDVVVVMGQATVQGVVLFDLLPKP
jgi:hypothetical protein